MRTPILIRDGSLFVLLDSRLQDPVEVSEGVWEHEPKAQGLYKKGLVDFVGLRGSDFLVNDDGDYHNRTLTIWANPSQTDPAAIQLSAADRLTITTWGKPLVLDDVPTRRNFAYRYETEATKFSYRLTEGDIVVGSESDLDHLVFSISRRPGLNLLDIIRWIAVGAGAGLAAGWLLGRK